jgi:hypothetical protein
MTSPLKDARATAGASSSGETWVLEVSRVAAITIVPSGISGMKASPKTASTAAMQIQEEPNRDAAALIWAPRLGCFRRIRAFVVTQR